MAVLLARFGHSVCVVDFDIESPGLPEKFSSIEALPQVDWGLVDYIHEARRGGKHPPLSDRLIRLTAPGGSGVIHLFPAGSIHGSYFDTIASPDWFNFLLSIEAHTNTRAFFLELRANIEATLHPKPDFLLIDSRSGVTELGGICTRLLADETVILTNDGADSLSGTNAILRSFEVARNAGRDAPNKVHLVLTRTPYYYFDASGDFHWLETGEIDAIQTRTLDHINHRLEHRFDVLHKFSLEPRILLDEHLLVKFHGRAESSPLANDYISFYRHLFGESQELQDLLGEVRVFRPYMLVKETGKIINPQDNTWNVAFRVDTLTKTFSSLYESIYTNALETNPEDVARAAAWKALFNSGLQAAEEFSHYLRDHRRTRQDGRGPRAVLKSLLDDWCRFDSTVGFGRFENQPSADGLRGEICLIDNFLLFGRPSHDIDLCAFMVGYITRVLSALVDVPLDEVRVTHDLARDCNLQEIDDGGNEITRCVFPYAISGGGDPRHGQG